MKAEIVVGDDVVHKVEVEERDGHYVVRIHDSETDASEEVTVNFSGSPGVANIVIEDQSFLVELSEGNGKYRTGIQTHTLEAQLYTSEDRLRELLTTSLGSRKDSIEAKMPGKVLDVFVKVGDRVAEGDKIAILEAMKMENTIRSPRNGTIASVGVAKGDNVQAGHTIITFEADP